MDQLQHQTTVNGPVVTLVEGGLSVDFSGHYGRPGMAAYDFFPMSRKRNFAHMAERSAGALAALLEDADFVLGLASLRYYISLPEDEEDAVTEETLAERLAELFDDRAVARIGGIVTQAYEDNEVDIDTEHSGRNNEELQFTNVHALIILRWSFACLAVTPVVTAFMDERDIKSGESMNLIMGCFCALLKRFEPTDGSIDILAKLRKLTESRILQTRYSDKIMWNYLRNLAVDTHIQLDRLVRKFVAEGVPKLEQGTNVIKFLHTFIKNQIKFQFTAKFPLSFKPVRPDVMDAEGQSAMKHLEGELIRRDEAAAVMTDLACMQAYRAACAELRWQPDEDDVRHWSVLLHEYGISDWQRGMVTKFFLPRVGRAEGIRTRTLGDYTRMTLVVREWLGANGFPVLRDYLGSRVVEGGDPRRIMTRKKFLREFIDSAQYRELLGSCFATTSQAVIDSDVVIRMISSVAVGVFEALPEPGAEAPKGEAPAVVEHRIEAIAQEVLRFIARIAHA